MLCIRADDHWISGSQGGIDVERVAVNSNPEGFTFHMNSVHELIL